MTEKNSPNLDRATRIAFEAFLIVPIKFAKKPAT